MMENVGVVELGAIVPFPDCTCFPFDVLLKVLRNVPTYVLTLFKDSR